MNAQMLHHLTIACTMAIVALQRSATTSLSGEKALDAATIERLTGVTGELGEQAGAFKVSVPRSDLDVSVAGVRMTPPLGLTSWAAFQKAGEQVMVMGDMVILEDQVNPVMSSNSHFEVLAGIGRHRDLQSLEHEVQEMVPAIKQEVACQRLQVLKKGLPGRQGLPHPVVLRIHPPQYCMEQKR
jgi:hypothetical protein